MKTKISNLMLVLLLTWYMSNAQSVEGFWKVTNVTVGERTMTPVAKWFRNNSDGTFQAGNGWTQNSYGTWTYDNKTHEFLPSNENGIKEDFGPFLVNHIAEGMTLTREEEGMMVTVSLVAIDELPMAPVDQVAGLWQLSVVKNSDDEEDDIDGISKSFMHIRPDRIYSIKRPDGQMEQDIWHMNMHRSELILINNDRTISDQKYMVSFEDNMLRMKSQDDNKRLFSYQRIFSFPEG